MSRIRLPALIFSVGLSLPFLSTAAFQYTVQSVCGQINCFNAILSDSGAVAGNFSLNSVGVFVNNPGQGFQDLTPQFNGSFFARSINRYGVIAGTMLAGNQASAAVYEPGSGQVLNLNPAFGWTNGNATHINDKGDVTGEGDRPLGPPYGAYMDRLLAITNDGVAIGTFNYPASQNVVVLTHSGAYTVAVGVPDSTAYDYLFNSSGQVLQYFLRPDKSSGDTWMFTPGQGSRQLTAISPLTYPRAINDSQTILLNGQSQALIYDAGGNIPEISSVPVSLQTLIPASSGWQILQGLALNNAGQILALAANNGSTNVLVLLTPNVQSVSGKSGLTPSSLRLPAAQDLPSAGFTLNGQAILQ